VDPKGGYEMAESILNGKLILAVDDEPEVLTDLEDENKEACPDGMIDQTTTYENTIGKQTTMN